MTTHLNLPEERMTKTWQNLENWNCLRNRQEMYLIRTNNTRIQIQSKTLNSIILEQHLQAKRVPSVSACLSY